jgi:uncharacterized protein (DUF885 family)
MTRKQTEVDRIAEAHLDETAALNPLIATYWGIAGHEDRMPDLSPDGLATNSELRRRTLTALKSADPEDANDRVTVAALREELELAEQIRATGAEEASLNNIDSPIQYVRDVFDLMATETEQDWALISSRLAAVPTAMSGYLASLWHAAALGDVSAARQVRAGITQSGRADEFFGQLLAAAPGHLPATLQADLARHAEGAVEAYSAVSRFLADELLAQAPERDAVGRERYALHSRAFLGSVIDLEETYEWGQQELARITQEMVKTAERILPGSTVEQAKEALESDPARLLDSREALVAWMQAKSDEAIASLAEEHFDIPEPVRRLECRIAPSGTGVIYYTGPSEDFSRPGRMWWSVPEGDNEFSTWRELTTVYHEGVPGHHLQVGQTVFRSELLNRWRRLACWVSGSGEGWALYAERLMADLGFLDDPGDYLGMLDAQGMRAARVVLDIGIHCGLPAPAEVGGGDWDYDKAWRFLGTHCSMGDSVRRFELERYLGWPGQAPSYKIGERLWLQLREDARRKEGDAFDLSAFHRRALDIGSVGLDVLRQAVLAEL